MPEHCQTGLPMPLMPPPPPDVHHQLLHHTAAALIEAERFCAADTVMVVHSFSPERRWFGAFGRFVGWFCLVGEVGVPAVFSAPGTGDQWSVGRVAKPAIERHEENYSVRSGLDPNAFHETSALIVDNLGFADDYLCNVSVI
jgi:hypothetical protein